MKKRTAGALLAVAVVLLGIGASMLGVLPLVVRTKAGKMMSITRDLEALRRWLKPPVPIYMKCYIFNLLNPDEFLNGGKANFSQVGPFVYREDRLKVVTEWNDEDGTVEYSEKKEFTFIKNMSAEADRKVITTLNIPLVSLLGAAEADKTKAPLLNMILPTIKQKSPTVKLSVKELLLRKNDIFSEANWNTAIKTMGIDFGILSSAEERYRMYTGKDDASKVDVIKEAYVKSPQSEGAFTRTMTTWGDKYCDLINGTDGSQLTPNVDMENRLYIFVKEFCRSIYMTFQEKTTVLGIDGYRYTIPENFFESPVKEPSNKCFCPYNNAECEKKGLLNLQKCRHGAPLYISAPHFYNADPSFLEDVEGLKPNPEEHEAFLTAEPLTGTILNVSRRIQINFRIKKQNRDGFQKLNDTVFPIAWLDEHAEIDEENANLFKEKVYKSQKVAKLVSGILIAIGGLIICCVIVFACRKKQDVSF